MYTLKFSIFSFHNENNNQTKFKNAFINAWLSCQTPVTLASCVICEKKLKKSTHVLQKNT